MSGRVRDAMGAGVEALRGSWQRASLAWRRRRAWRIRPGAIARVGRYRVHLTDGPNLYVQYKDEFIRRVYDFVASRPRPLIVDAGSNVGMSVLCQKLRHPDARIVAVEPDPEIFRLLERNVRENGLHDVRLINAALAAAPGTQAFRADGRAGGRLTGDGGAHVEVRTLSGLLDEPVDFLKMNIEGAELDVLTEASRTGALGRVEQMVIEYHGWARAPQRLGPLLDLLDSERFRYLVHDFDAETCPATKPPFRIDVSTTWFCLVYARRTV